MNFQQAVTTCLQKYVGFDGRASRSEFWWFALFQIGVIVVVSMVHQQLGNIASLLLLLPALAVGTRRLHDLGKSGWFQLLGFIPLIGWAILIYWYVQPGQLEANAYGEPPSVASATA
jgi:uncharacterized membrane protein YhaH (DUF805 family)